MPTYRMTATEVTEHTFTVEADSLDEAKDAYLNEDVATVEYAVNERYHADITADGTSVDDDGED